MKSPKKIIALFDTAGIYVYQAFDKEIASEAVKLGFFGKNFNLNRLSWIKTSLGWMLYRSDYATKAGQTRILKIKICHQGFLEILNKAIPTIQDPNIFSSGKEWRKEIQKTEVRYQWDPDRNSQLQVMPRRAIQLGLQGETLETYAKKWILELEDITFLARKIEMNPKNSTLWPDEKEYILQPKIMKKLGM